jgi:hypothetical protein
MELIFFFGMIVSLFIVFAVDARQKRCKYLLQGKENH